MHHKNGKPVNFAEAPNNFGRGGRVYRAPKKAEACHPMVSKLFEIMAREKIMASDIARATGLSPAVINNWRTRYSPTLDAYLTALDGCGYQVCIRKKT